MNPRAFIRSVAYAIRGLARALRTEQNLRIEMIVGAVVIVGAAWLDATPRDLALLVLVVTSVLVLELVNTMVEALLDLLKPRLHHYAALVKDVMAAAVLVASISAIFIGILILLPYLLS